MGESLVHGRIVMIHLSDSKENTNKKSQPLRLKDCHCNFMLIREKIDDEFKGKCRNFKNFFVMQKFTRK